MVGEQKRKERAALVTKALLLGYSIEPYAGGGLILVYEGKTCFDPNRLHVDAWTYPSRWRAAQKALELSGVPCDTKKSSGDLGVGSGARYRLRGRQRLRGSSSRVTEGAGTGRERKKT